MDQTSHQTSCPRCGGAASSCSTHLPAGEKAVAVQLLGGLGNQMFQAAAGYALARRLGAPLMFDLTRFREKGLRSFALAPFFAEPSPLAARTRVDERVKEGWLARQITRLGARLGRDKHRPKWWKGALYREPQFGFDAGFAGLSAPVLIAGYFQSPRYFADCADEVAAVFAAEKLASARAMELAKPLAGETSVALHLRRGDFASDPRAAAVHGVMGLEYYDAAVAHIRERVADAQIFVVSDDFRAAREVAKRWPGAHSLAGTSAGDDLYLMSAARHHIIANSSFSWWSAWLDRREGGIRIAPQRWFTPEAAASRPTDDLIPADWVRL